ncbi:hemolymph lipopolysaccharide-binding protein-like [Periplaneta americana]|uniref:hemolymph lipopolysaccharide-binding protein-like n=1 Tax=Periplaneta americana TaxID=6978 RepID=UPI0037E799E6
MGTSRWLVLFYSLLLSGTSFATNSTDCSSSPQDLKITILSRRNKTGHFIAKVKLEEGLEEETSEKRSWEVNIDHDATCESDVGPTDLQVEPREPPRPGYVLFPKLGYFKLHNIGKTWNEAKLICEAEGAHLGIVNSKKEVEIVRELRTRLPKLFGNWVDDHIYTGVNDLQHANTWVTIFEQPLSATGFSVWDNGEPDVGANEHCVALHTGVGRLHNIACTTGAPFYCEREL